MVTEVVLDSSVIIALATVEDYSSWARAKMSEHGFFHILDLSYYEVANGLSYKRSEKFSAKQVEDAFTESLELMNLFGVHSFGEIVMDAMNIASQVGISVYDAAFLCLADKLDNRLVTLDLRLAKKVENTKYRGLVEFPNK